MPSPSQISSIIKGSSLHDKALLYMEDIASTIIADKPLLEDKQIDALDASVSAQQREEYETLMKSIERVAGALFEFREVLFELETKLVDAFSDAFGDSTDETVLSPEEETRVEGEVRGVLLEVVHEISLLKGALKALDEYVHENKLHSAAFERVVELLEKQAEEILEGTSIDYRAIDSSVDMYQKYGEAIRSATSSCDEECDEECDEDEHEDCDEDSCSDND